MPIIKRARKNKIKLVKIEWVDSVQPTAEWQYLSEYKPSKPIGCVSVGFLIHSDKETKAIAQNMGSIEKEKHEQASGIIHIPTKSVIRIKEIK